MMGLRDVPVRLTVERVTEVVVAALLTISALALFLQVVFRYVLKNPLTWTEEVARYSTVVVVFLATPLAFAYKIHPEISLLSALGRSGRCAKLLRLSLVMAFSGLLVASGLRFSEIGTRVISPALSVPMHLLYMFIPLGSLILLVEAIWALQEFTRESGKGARDGRKSSQ